MLEQVLFEKMIQLYYLEFEILFKNIQCGIVK